MEGKQGEGSEWTEREQVLLVECAVHMQEVTGHGIGECAVKLNELIQGYKSAKGRKKSND
jgi:hypothetical protein